MEEIAKCPVCGSPMRPPDSYDATMNCSSMECCYGVAYADEHNALARRAEIGALVERIVENIEYIPDDGRLFVGHGGESVGIEDDFGEHLHVAGATLLEALRALAKEIGCE